MKVGITSPFFIIVLILVSCAPATKVVSREAIVPVSTATLIPIPAVPTYLDSYPPCLSSSGDSTPEYVSSTLQISLSNGLTLREYQDRGRIQDNGCLYRTRYMASKLTEVNLNNLFRVIVTPTEDKKEKVVVMQNSNKVFEIETYPVVYSGLLAAWEYDNHWVIEVMVSKGTSRNTEGIDIIRDGVSLKETNNYQDVFAFQLLDNKPFYFFTKYDNTFGINYDGIETNLDYDNVPYPDLHPAADGSIAQYQNMVLFPANKEGVWRNVAIGTFNER